MEGVLVLLLALSALASAHYQGYPFKHKNEGKYGADHPYANYGPADQPRQEEEAYPVAYPLYSGYDYGTHPYNNFYGYYPNNNFYGQHHGFYGYNKGDYGYNQGDYGYNHGDYAHNHEFDYRSYPGFPIHQGYGEFQFLGTYGGQCDAAHDHGLYIADDANSFVVCVYGRSHRFQCPKGTRNRAYIDLQHEHKYGVDELCGVNTRGSSK